MQPPTLFVNKATIAGERHAEMTWGAAQAAVAAGVADCIADDTIKAEWLGELVLIASVWVNPNAADAKAVFENNRRATRRGAAARCAWRTRSSRRCSTPATIPWNPFYRPR